MVQILPPKLTDLELEALRQIAVHPATRHIPYRVQSRLKDIGYAKEVLGGLVLTDDGLQRIAIDRERVRTFVQADASRDSRNAAGAFLFGRRRCPLRSETCPEGCKSLDPGRRRSIFRGWPRRRRH